MLMAIVSIVVALALLALVGQAFPLSVFATNMLTGMGLALGIDYSLFVLSRYREERLHGREQLDAIAAVGATASRAVLFSGIAFTLAMVGLLLVPQHDHAKPRRRRDRGRAGLGGRRADAATGAPGPARGSRQRAAHPVLRPHRGPRAEPVLVSDGASGDEAAARAASCSPRAILLAMAAPVLALRSGEAGVSTLPDRLPAKQGYLALNAEFPGETTEPVEIVIDGDAASPAVQDRDRAPEGAAGERGSLRSRRARDQPGGRSHGPDRPDPRAIRSARTRSTRSASCAASTFPDAFPDAGVEVLVAGDTAESIDESDTMSDWLPIVLAFVLGLSFVLLTIAFRSLVVAAKAIAVNLLSVGAAYGLLVLVFQEGVGNELFGFPQVDTIEAWVPLFLFAVLFGLSMDYHVFLLSRIRERFRQTGDNSDAIAHGVGSTGRIITGAALIIVAVFSGFARGDLVMFQQMGFGVAVALLLDATMVRLVLVPAAMELLGERNWYLPSWLRWLPDVHVEGTRTAQTREPQTGPRR